MRVVFTMIVSPTDLGGCVASAKTAARIHMWRTASYTIARDAAGAAVHSAARGHDRPGARGRPRVEVALVPRREGPLTPSANRRHLSDREITPVPWRLGPTTNRYAEITVRSKEAAVRACEAPGEFSVALA